MKKHRSTQGVRNAVLLAVLLIPSLLIAGRFLAAVEPGDKSFKELTRWGVPDGTGVLREKYLLGYDGRTRSARWVLERLDSRTLAKNVQRDTERFVADPLAGEEFRATGADYSKSGFDIGHLAPADAHRITQSDLDSTFLYSNATPQLPAFNRGLWRSLEAEVREIGETSPVWIITAPLWIPEDGKLSIETIGPHGVWVPTHCGKAILIEGRKKEIEVKAWILPHEGLKGRKLEEFEVSIDQFETAAGFDCWAELPDELEAELEKGE